MGRQNRLDTDFDRETPPVVLSNSETVKQLHGNMSFQLDVLAHGILTERQVADVLAKFESIRDLTDIHLDDTETIIADCLLNVLQKSKASIEEQETALNDLREERLLCTIPLPPRINSTHRETKDLDTFSAARQLIFRILHGTND